MTENHDESAKKVWAALANLQMFQSEQHKLLQSVLTALETDNK